MLEDYSYLWSFLFKGYCITIMIEIPVLLIGLSCSHKLKNRLFAGFWLTACTYPIVILVLPVLFSIELSNTRYIWYLIVAETFAPIAECVLFRFVYHQTPEWMGEELRKSRWRDYGVIVFANITSFSIGYWVL